MIAGGTDPVEPLSQQHVDVVGPVTAMVRRLTDHGAREVVGTGLHTRLRATSEPNDSASF
ncbi:hypothetical protein CCE02nite_31530 [Cellulosimicrobium cellulans]|uniref:Uncharacterized protein n=1 Tax=Cellulosimicrobium cellulans TaxID=1710 RepID=A0A4Y4E554_CELCE|nr:hypothetical protein CCE02nite_31530 [Cellulosimicrobium cellulans]